MICACAVSSLEIMVVKSFMVTQKLFPSFLRSDVSLPTTFIPERNVFEVRSDICVTNDTLFKVEITVPLPPEDGPTTKSHVVGVERRDPITIERRSVKSASSSE